MFYHVKQVLSAEQVKQVLNLTRQAKFIDGSATNKHSRAKQNMQMATDDPRMKEPGAIIKQSMLGNQEVRAIVRPLRMTPPLFSRYEPGMAYGDHADQALLTAGVLVRTDISCTVFLSAAEDYDGGELVVRLGNQEHRMKGDAGDVVLYPSVSLHRVQPVTKGVREVAVTWFQSIMRDAHKREVLYSLQTALDEILLKDVDQDIAVRLSYVHANLTRMWSEV